MSICTARSALFASASALLIFAAAPGCAGRMAAGHMARKALTQHDAAGAKHYATMDEANMAFYAALNAMCAGDAQGMESVWSHAADVSDFGPNGKTNFGFDAVMGRFRSEAGMKMGGTVAAQSGLSIEMFTTQLAMMANAAVTPDAQEGIAAFLEKRKPGWIR
jgi:enoyl-CoA hydratase/carnithine racemase